MSAIKKAAAALLDNESTHWAGRRVASALEEVEARLEALESPGGAPATEPKYEYDFYPVNGAGWSGPICGSVFFDLLDVGVRMRKVKRRKVSDWEMLNPPGWIDKSTPPPEPSEDGHCPPYTEERKSVGQLVDELERRLSDTLRAACRHWLDKKGVHLTPPPPSGTI